MGRQRGSVGNVVIGQSGHQQSISQQKTSSNSSNNMKAPPPPPPGPPPKKVKKRDSVAGNVNLNASSNTGDVNVSAGSGNEATAMSHQQQQLGVGQHTADQQHPDTNKGETWSPREEIQAGNVAKFKQLLWGGDTDNNNNNAAISTPTHHHQGSKQLQQRVLPPITPPRPHSHFATSPVTNSSSNKGGGRRSTRSPSPPKYKLNAPPPLGIGTNDHANVSGGSNQHHQQRTPPRSATNLAPPSRVLHARGTPDRSNPSPLRQRLGNLTPIDTSFGGGKSGRGGGADSNSSNGNNTGGDKVTPTASSTRSRQLGSPFHNDTSNNNAEAAIGNANHAIHNATNAIHHHNSNNNASPSRSSPIGITTLTAFKRPQQKVGIIFTRKSKQFMDVPVISKIMNDSIFAGHHANYGGKCFSEAMGGDGGIGGVGGGGGLEGAEVIAVNGTPVRDPRHAAELVANAVDEIRLTIKRVGARGGSVGGSSPMPQAATPFLEKEGEGQEEEGNRTIDMDEESALSAKTEEDRKFEISGRVGGLSVNTDRSRRSDQQQQQTTPKSSKSQDIAERRRKIAQAMLMSAEMVEDPINSASSGGKLFGVISEDYWDASNHDWRESVEVGSGRISAIEADSSEKEEKDVVEIEREVLAYVTTPLKEQSPAFTSPRSARSAAEKRRQAAMLMYNSEKMVDDNVDDLRLGTIDAIGLKDTISGPSPVQKAGSEVSFEGNASVAKTDITTSSSATQRMGSSPHNRQLDGHAFSFAESATRAVGGAGGEGPSPRNPVRLESPVAQRRKERAQKRLMMVDPNETSTDAPSPMAIGKPNIPISTAAIKKQPILKPAPSNNAPPTPTSQIQRIKTDESVAASSAAAGSGVAASNVAVSSSVVSEVNGESRTSRSIFGSKKKSSSQNAVSSGDKKKKKSIFGVANLIRKASVRSVLLQRYYAT